MLQQKLLSMKIDLILLPRSISGKLCVEDLEMETLNMATEPQENYSK